MNDLNTSESRKPTGQQDSKKWGLPAAVLWDMDGTLVDTEPYWIECEFALAEKYGGTWSQQHALNLVGRDLLDSASYIKEHMGIGDLRPEEIRDELLDGVIAAVQQRVPWQPGAPELLASLRAAGIPTALVTMSYRRFAEPVVAALPPGSFDVLVPGDEVTRGKPFADPYVRACQLLGVDPAETVAIEDSPTGVESALAAGCSVLVVPNHVAVPQGPGRTFARSLADVSISDLGLLIA